MGHSPVRAYACRRTHAALGSDVAARGCVTASELSHSVRKKGSRLMTTNALPRTPARPMTAAPVPPWARRAAAAVLWTSMPSALWRFAVVLGVPLGLAESEYDAMLIPGWGYLIVPLPCSPRPYPQRWAHSPARSYGVLFVWTTLHADMAITPWGEWVMTMCYVPIVAWGPLLAVTTVHYYRRRTLS